MNARRPASLALAALLGPVLGAAAAAQAPPKVTARLSTGVASLGSEVSLVIEVEGAEEASIPALPGVEGLLLGPPLGPSVEDAFSIFGGRQRHSRKLAWAVPIKPQRAGEFTIPPIEVRADGRRLATSELALRVVVDLLGEELGVFEILAPASVFEGQPFLVELRFGFDTDLGGIGEKVNYINLSVPWLGQQPGVLELETPVAPPGTAWVENVTLNSRGTTSAERMPDGKLGDRTCYMMKIRRRYVATRAGRLEFPVSHLEFGRVERGFMGLGPADRRTNFKRFPPFAIEVLRLPEEGRPLDYTGAVGTLTANVSADRRDVDAGDSIKVSVEWTGEGNLEFFDPPDPSRMESFKEFRLYGTTERKTPERRVVTYDLAPVSPSVQAIPSLPLHVFVPAERAYVTLATSPIPIRVRPLEKGAVLPDEERRDESALDIRDVQAGAEERDRLPRPSEGLLLAALLGVPALWMATRTAVRRRDDPDSPRARARRRARRLLARELEAARTASAQTAALLRFLSARTGEADQAWLGRDPVAWAAEHRTDLEPGRAGALGLRDLLARLDERAWAGNDDALDPREILSLAERLLKEGL